MRLFAFFSFFGMGISALAAGNTAFADCYDSSWGRGMTDDQRIDLCAGTP